MPCTIRGIGLEPIKVASLKGHLDVVKHLVGLGIELTDEVFQNALISGRLDVVEFIIKSTGRKFLKIYNLPVHVPSTHPELFLFLLESGMEFCNKMPMPWFVNKTQVSSREELINVIKIHLIHME